MAIDIAKIEDSGRYKHVMRHIQSPDVTAMHLQKPGLRYPGDEVAQSSLLLRVRYTLSLPPFLDKALNRWQHQSPEVTAFEAMLLALEVVAESCLEGPVAVTDLAVPFPLPNPEREFYNPPPVWLVSKAP